MSSSTVLCFYTICALGAVYLFGTMDGGVSWTEQQILSPHGHDGAQFGLSVALSDNLLVVGSPNLVNQRGVDAG